MIQEVFKQIGLNSNEIELYTLLLRLGEAKAGDLIKKTSLKRGTVYNALRSLGEKHLIEEIIQGKTTTFRVLHPNHLKLLLQNKEEELQEADKALDTVIDKLKSSYTLARNKPDVHFFEGEEGFKQIYKDITSKPNHKLQLVRSTYEDNVEYESAYTDEFRDWIVKSHIKDRVRKNISTHTISPDEKEANHDPALDKKRLVHRQWVDKKLYDSPVEIDIYRDKVAFLSFGKELIGFIIQSPQIARAMKQIFKLARIGAKESRKKK